MLALPDLCRAVQCHESYKYYTLGLNAPAPEPFVTARQKGLAALKESIQSGKDLADALTSISSAVLSAVSGNSLSEEAERELATEEISRICQYIYDCGLNKAQIETDILATLKLPVAVVLGNDECVAVKVKADIVFTADGKTRAVRFKYGEQPYTTRTGSRHHMSLAEELAALSLSFKDRGEIIPELWYLKGKDDKSGQPLPRYEVRENKNIARWIYKGDEAERVLTDALKATGSPDCEKCPYKDICKQTSFSDVRLITKKRHGKEAPKFTPEQEAVVNHKDGPAAVVAVPGSGKTFTLAHRFCKLVEGGVSPESILCISFTASAAKEMEERIRALTGITTELSITTFNAFGYKILQANPLLVGQRVKLADETDRKKLLEQAVEECPKIVGMSYANMKGKFGVITELIKKFRALQDDGLDAFHKRFDGKLDVEGILAVHKRLDELLKEGGFITFDEQITLTNKLFERYPGLTQLLADKYRYIMVDEYQDTNKEQKDLIYAIARRHNNLLVVGDDDQSIYGFRGGSNRFLLDFPKDFPGAKVYHLAMNFRSVSHIIDVANAVMEGVEERYKKVLKTSQHAENRVYWSKGGIAEVVSYVSEFINRYNYTPSSICVLARKNSCLEDIQAGLAAAGIDSTCPKDRLVDDPVFNIVRTVLSLYEDLNDDHALARVFKWYKQEIPQKEGGRGSLYESLAARWSDWFEDYRFNERESFEALPEEQQVLHKLYAMLSILAKYPVDRAFDMMAPILRLPENYMVLDEIKDMVALKGFTSPEEISAHMADMEEYRDTARVIYDVEPSKVRLVTEHDSKGHEYPIVIIYGMEDFEVADKTEERRLLYVSITRAKQVLVMIEGCGPRKFEGFDWIKDLIIQKPQKTA